MKFKVVGVVLALAAMGSALAGLTDFSAGLLAWAGSRYGREAPGRLQVWQRMVRDSRPADARTADPAANLRRTNDFFNQVPYFSDAKHWGAEDYWATPVEMLASLGGDCEDYSIGKYLTLKDLGIPVDRLRITYVRAIKLNESHMVLAYYATPDAEPLILDNLNGSILPASQRSDLEPVYSFNDDDLWLPTGQAKKGGASNVRLWRDLLERLAKEQKM